MYALFEEAGKFLAGRVMTEAENSAQIELESGKRVKVKAANVLLKFEQPTPAELIASAHALAKEIDLDLAWEFAPDSEFGFADLARDYFEAGRRRREAGRRAVPPVRGAALLPPRSARATSRRRPRRSSRPRCSASSARSSWPRRSMPGPTELVGRRLPGAGARAALPDPLQAGQATRPSTRRWSRRRTAAHRAPLDLLKAAGAIDSPVPVPLAALPVRAVSRRAPRFRRLPVPRGQGHAAARAGARPSRSTIRRRPRSTMRCRCRASAAAGHASASTSPHRASPSRPTRPLDRVARERLSTVYMPGWKITMLPDAIVAGLHADRGPRLPRRQRCT